MLLQEKKDILCPDCEINYITKEEEKIYNKCLSCRRRENIANIRGYSYIPKKLDKNQIINVKTKIRRIGRGNRMRYTKEFHELVKSIPDNTLLEQLEIIHNLLPDYKDLDEIKYRAFLANYKYPFIKQNDYENKNYIMKENQEKIEKSSKKKYPKNTKNTIYTKEVMDYLYAIANNNVTRKQLITSLQNKFPDKNITDKNMNNILNRHNIPYRKSRSNKIAEEKVLIPIDSSSIHIDPTITVKFIESDINKHIFEKPEDKELKDRLEPIEKEVDSILASKYKERKCDFDLKYSTDDYIKVFEILKFLIQNKSKMFSIGASQHAIADAYCRDTAHECESVLSKPGDTYFQDKLYVIRDRRRKLEHNAGDLKIMYDFLSKLNCDMINQIYDDLCKTKEDRKDPKYIPQVDYTMLEKYDWCIEGDKDIFDIYNKPGSMLDSRTKQEVEQQKSQTKNITSAKPKVSKFRVSCNVSGGGFGAFKAWSKEYTTLNENMARTYAENELEVLRAKHKGILITNFQVIKIN